MSKDKKAAAAASAEKENNTSTKAKPKKVVVAVTACVVVVIAAVVVCLMMTGRRNISATGLSEQELSQKLVSAEIGDTVFFGGVDQNGNRFDGKEYIEWQVVDNKDGRLLLVAKNAVSANQSDSAVSDVCWENSAMRTYLNGKFFNDAFSSDEQAKILSTTVFPDDNPFYSTDAGNKTSDRVFILSLTEAQEYFTSADARICAENNSDANCSWWLRTPGESADKLAFVSDSGSVVYAGASADSAEISIRPAIWINPEN